MFGNGGFAAQYPCQASTTGDPSLGVVVAVEFRRIEDVGDGEPDVPMLRRATGTAQTSMADEEEVTGRADVVRVVGRGRWKSGRVRSNGNDRIGVRNILDFVVLFVDGG